MKDLTLYYYEHCPYCIRVLTYCGMADIPLIHRVLLNDDEDTPISLVGKKMLPILQYTDDTGKLRMMDESLDIIEHLAEDDGYGLLRDNSDEENVAAFWQEVRLSAYSLGMPRWVNLSLGEFENTLAIDYFVEKKTHTIGDFEKALTRTLYWQSVLLNGLEKYDFLFKSLIKKPNSQAAILLFSFLRGVTCVKNLHLTKNVVDFLALMEAKTSVGLFFDRAI